MLVIYFLFLLQLLATEFVEQLTNAYFFYLFKEKFNKISLYNICIKLLRISSI